MLELCPNIKYLFSNLFEHHNLCFTFLSGIELGSDKGKNSRRYFTYVNNYNGVVESKWVSSNTMINLYGLIKGVIVNGYLKLFFFMSIIKL
jgi:hypothetical protein